MISGAGVTGLAALVRCAILWKVAAWSMQPGRNEEERQHARAMTRMLTPSLRGRKSEPAESSADELVQPKQLPRPRRPRATPKVETKTVEPQTAVTTTSS